MKNKFGFNWEEVVTPEVFAGWKREVQIGYITSVDGDFLDVFRQLHGRLSAEEELELMSWGVINLNESTHQAEYDSQTWVQLLHDGIAGDSDIEKYFGWDNFSLEELVEILSNGDDGYRRFRYCKPVEFSGYHWVELLKANAKFAGECPFELLESEEIDTILLHRPELAGECGLNNPYSLILENRQPEEAEDLDIFFPILHKTEFAAKIKDFFVRNFSLTARECEQFACHVTFNRQTKLGVYSKDYALDLMNKLIPELADINGVTLKTEPWNPAGFTCGKCGSRFDNIKNI